MPPRQDNKKLRVVARRSSKLLIPLLALCLLMYGGFGLWQRFRATHHRHPLPSGQATITHSTPTPDETVPPATAPKYTVPPDQPRFITLPTIGVEGFIQKVATDQYKAIAAPSNVHMAGWYTLSKKPGESGVSLIDGHVQGKYEPGVFKNLQRLRSGDIFSVGFGDMSRRRFQVVVVNQYSPAEAATTMLRQKPGIASQLNLITCSGHYDKGSKQYDKRVLVVSKFLP